MVFKRVSVVGLGYIGLPTAAMFASHGLHVIGVDVSHFVIDTINSGNIHIVEIGLEQMVEKAVKSGNLRAVLTPEVADAFLIAVPTPFKGEDHEPDLSFIESACNAIAPVLKPGNIVILESTSPVGSTEVMEKWLSAARPDLTFPYTDGERSDIRIAHCPERVLPGKIMEELISNDRVIGGATSLCAEIAISLYKTFVKGECVIASSSRVAEMAKLTENSFRDVNIAFANELSLICDKLNIDVWELIKLANRHPRVNVLKPGPGVGGHCIAIDPWFIVASAPEEARLIATARRVNDDKPVWVLAKIKECIDTIRKSRKANNVNVALLGLSFKPDVDDLRESPAMYIAKEVAAMKEINTVCVEPYVIDLPNPLREIARLCDVEEAINQADLVVLLVAHKQFKFLKRSHFNGRLVIDTVGLWESN
jgi:UDP-N-acetyl-D-mannosaminuronic acid dehydrogenase